MLQQLQLLHWWWVRAYCEMGTDKLPKDRALK